VWPWPFKFAVVLNIPALIGGALLGWSLETLHLDLPEWALYLPALLCVALLWHWIGLRLDRRHYADRNAATKGKQWIAVFGFVGICAAASALPQRVVGYTAYFGIGAVIWIITAIAFGVDALFRRHRAG
jgi:hypothetical protein